MLRASSLALGHLPTRHRPSALLRSFASTLCHHPPSNPPTSHQPDSLLPKNSTEEDASLPPLPLPLPPRLSNHSQDASTSSSDSSSAHISVPSTTSLPHTPVSSHDPWTPFLPADRDIWSDNPIVRPGIWAHRPKREVPPMSLPQSLVDDPNADQNFVKLLHELSQTSSAAHAWELYIALRNFKAQAGRCPPIPLAILHRLSDLLASARPRTPKLFYQLLDVATFIRRSGGVLRSNNWTALIHSAGMMKRGKPTLADFERSLSIYQDMIEGRPPGSGIMKSLSSVGYGEDNYYQIAVPDIFTYNALMTVATHTLKREAVEYVLSLLKKSGLQWSRITYLTLLDYFSDTKTIECVRSVAYRLNGLRYELGIDGINACLWAYGQSGRVDIVMSIFRLLWHNVSSKCPYDDELRSLAQDIEAHEHIVVPNSLIPDELTFNVVIQVLAYHGDFKGTLRTFADMISTKKVEYGTGMTPLEQEQKSECYSPNYVIYRAIFLGFSRHAVPPGHVTTGPSWTLDNLMTIFNTFMAWEDAEIKPQLIYWIVLAFDKASGRDIVLLRSIWLQLEKKFNGPWEGEDDRLTRLRKALFPLEKYGLDGFS